jgi:hypothetical protein
MIYVVIVVLTLSSLVLATIAIQLVDYRPRMRSGR